MTLKGSPASCVLMCRACVAALCLVHFTVCCANICSDRKLLHTPHCCHHHPSYHHPSYHKTHHQGCVLEEYSVGVDERLRGLELESIQDYITESDNLVDLHRQVCGVGG